MKAVRTFEDIPAAFTIASVDETDVLRLDLGELPRRNRTLWPGVIYVRSLADEPLALSFEVEGAIVPLIGTVRAGPPGWGDLEPGEMRHVVVQADVGQADAGDYEGAVIVRVGPDWRFELPARLTVK